MIRLFSWLVIAAALPGLAHSAEVITDESTRAEVLAALFPNMKIEVRQDVRINNGSHPKPPSKDLPFPDALALERVYRVVGHYKNDDERCASENLQNGTFSDVRQLRMRVWGWPGGAGRADLLALVQYEFVGAAPAGACWSIGQIFRVKRSETGLGIVATVLLDAMHHTGIQSAELIDLDGDRVDELVIESDVGGAGMIASNLLVFRLATGEFQRWLSVPSRLFESADEIQQYTQILDVEHTLRRGGREFCFIKVVLAAHGLWLPEPLKTQPCYPRFTGTAGQGTPR